MQQELTDVFGRDLTGKIMEYVNADDKRKHKKKYKKVLKHLKYHYMTTSEGEFPNVGDNWQGGVVTASGLWKDNELIGHWIRRVCTHDTKSTLTERYFVYPFKQHEMLTLHADFLTAEQEKEIKNKYKIKIMVRHFIAPTHEIKQPNCAIV